MSIRLENLALSAGTFARVGLDLQVPDGGYAVLMGRTGCGKTTLLETVCGLRPSVGGRILLAGVDVTHRRAAERGIGYVPQDAGLFPTMTVRMQLGFALVIRKQPGPLIQQRVSELAQLLGDHVPSRSAAHRAQRGGAAARRPGPGLVVPATSAAAR